MTFVPNYQRQEASSAIYALNVNNQWSQNSGGEVEGSAFIRLLRPVHPFEAYMTVEGAAAAQRSIPIFGDGETTDVGASLVDGGKLEVENWYTLDGRKLQRRPNEKGVYIRNGRKVVVR